MAKELPIHLRRGKHAEDRALTYLLSQGLQLLRRNYRTPHGEIDLIMLDSALDELIFAEVRYRKNDRFGGAAQSVDKPKQARLIASAEFFLQRHARFGNTPCRLDVIALSGGPEKGSLQWYRNAF